MQVWQRLADRLQRGDRSWGAGLAAASAVPPASRLGLLWVPLVALALAAAVVLSPLEVKLSASLHDAGLRAVARPAHYDDVLVIDIDDASLRALRPRLGSWPYSRDTFALVIGYLRDLGARVIVLDIVLAESRDGDTVLARKLADRGDVVLAAAGLKRAVELAPVAPPAASAPASAPLPQHFALPPEPALPAKRWAALSLPAEPLLAALAAVSGPGAVGVISVPLDTDGLLRRLPLLHVANGPTYPSLPLAVQLLAPSEPHPDPGLRYHDHVLQLGARRWPVDDEGKVSLLLPQNRDAVPSIAFSNLMAAALGMSEGAGLRQAVQGRTVFVGSSAFLADDVMTPQGPVSGTGFLAAAHAALQRGEVIDRSAPLLAAWLVGIALTPSAWIALRRRPVLAHDAAASLLALAALLVVSLGALALARTEVAWLFALVVVVAGFVLAALLQLRWVGLANRQLSLERAVAEAANQAKTEFLANVSHEIRTPMNALLGVAELLQRTPLNVEQQRYVEVFRRSGQTLFELINDLLDLSKIEAGRLELEPRPFSLHRLLEDQRALLSAKAAGKGLALDLHRAENLPDAVVGDRRRLAQVLTNLVGNAIKFTPAGQVNLSVAPGADGIRFDVSDTGIGIFAAQQDRIFQPFTQADASATRTYGGTGLGLSIAKSLVEQMGGHIELRSTPGVGSVFSFCVPLPEAPPGPLTDEPGAAAAATLAPPAVAVWPPTVHAAPAATAASERSAGRPFRVLLTEDNEINVLMVEAMLRDSGCTLDVAISGEDALNKFRNGDYDVVLMDVQMPGLDGHETTREIRRIEAAEGRRAVAIVALTANAFERDVQRSLEAGCNAHVSKPVSREALLAAINAFRTSDRSSVREEPPAA